MIVLFARQVGEASEAASHADAMRAANTALAVEVAASERELEQIQQLPYIEQQAREYRLGHPREIPFILADDAPRLPADAPGSAAVRLGEVATRPSPLSSWLDLLFGSSNGARGASGPSSGQEYGAPEPPSAPHRRALCFGRRGPPAGIDVRPPRPASGRGGWAAIA